MSDSSTLRASTDVECPVLLPTRPKTQPIIYSADETAGVGVDAETPVSDDYTLETSKFNGTIHNVAVSTSP